MKICDYIVVLKMWWWRDESEKAFNGESISLLC